MRKLRRTIRVASLALLAYAVLKELSKPEDEREWHGEIGGLVPYELRRPTLARMRSRWWDPEGSVVQPTVFGAGWTLNVGRLVELVRARTGGIDGAA